MIERVPTEELLANKILREKDKWIRQSYQVTKVSDKFDKLLDVIQVWALQCIFVGLISLNTSNDQSYVISVETTKKTLH